MFPADAEHAAYQAIAGETLVLGPMRLSARRRMPNHWLISIVPKRAYADLLAMPVCFARSVDSPPFRRYAEMKSSAMFVLTTPLFGEPIRSPQGA
jgi:hypothetical protein